MYYIPVSAFDSPVFPYIEPILETGEIVAHGKRNYLLLASKLFALIGIIFLLVSYGPSVWYSLRGTDRISKLLQGTASPTNNMALAKPSWQPAFDRDLPLENKLIIPSIGVNTLIHEAKNESFEEALKEGVWRVNDFGTPYDRTAPTILAAHRYGYIAWSLAFRLHESFYELPNLKEGDTITIIWRQRKYLYAVYKSEEGTEITDYKADLILYTCRDLTSEIREIKYARLIQN